MKSSGVSQQHMPHTGVEGQAGSAGGQHSHQAISHGVPLRQEWVDCQPGIGPGAIRARDSCGQARYQHQTAPNANAAMMRRIAQLSYDHLGVDGHPDFDAVAAAISREACQQLAEAVAVGQWLPPSQRLYPVAPNLVVKAWQVLWQTADLSSILGGVEPTPAVIAAVVPPSAQATGVESSEGLPASAPLPAATPTIPAPMFRAATPPSSSSARIPGTTAAMQTADLRVPVPLYQPGRIPIVSSQSNLSVGHSVQNHLPSHHMPSVPASAAAVQLTPAFILPTTSSLLGTAAATSDAGASSSQPADTTPATTIATSSRSSASQPLLALQLPEAAWPEADNVASLAARPVATKRQEVGAHAKAVIGHLFASTATATIPVPMPEAPASKALTCTPTSQATPVSADAALPDPPTPLLQAQGVESSVSRLMPGTAAGTYDALTSAARKDIDTDIRMAPVSSIAAKAPPLPMDRSPSLDFTSLLSATPQPNHSKSSISKALLPAVQQPSGRFVVEQLPQKRLRLDAATLCKDPVSGQGSQGPSPLLRRVPVKEEPTHSSLSGSDSPSAASLQPTSSAPVQCWRDSSEGNQHHEPISKHRQAVSTFPDGSTMQKRSSVPPSLGGVSLAGASHGSRAESAVSGSKGIKRVCAWCQYSRVIPHPQVCFLRCREHRHPFYCVSDSAKCVPPSSQDKMRHDAIKATLHR